MGKIIVLSIGTVVLGAMFCIALFMFCVGDLPLGQAVPQATLDQGVSQRVDLLVKDNKLEEARQLLEKTENEIGLTKEQSDLLDSLYLKLANQLLKKGDKKAAVALAKLIPEGEASSAAARKIISKYGHGK